MKGVGNAHVPIVGKLVDVPISMGSNQQRGSCVRMTFFIIAAPTYHWILGLDLLAMIQGCVHCAHHVLSYQLSAQGSNAQVALPLAPRSSIKHQPVYARYLAATTPQRPATPPTQPAAPQAWEYSCISAEQVEYLGVELLDVAARAALVTDQAMHPCAARDILDPLTLHDSTHGARAHTATHALTLAFTVAEAANMET